MSRSLCGPPKQIGAGQTAENQGLGAMGIFVFGTEANISLKPPLLLRNKCVEKDPRWGTPQEICP